MYFVGRKALISIALLLVALFTVQVTWAQGGSTTIRGTVTDAQGAAVAKATVTITNPANNFSRTQVTTATGSYSFELIPVADYTLKVEAAGFRKAEFRAVHGLVDTVVTIDAKLEIGSLSETVQVEASSAAVQINTQDATLGNSIVSQQILQLPMEARNVQSLLTLQPGVTPDGYVSGARSDQSNITLDGVDINEAQSSDIGSPVLRLNAEAIEEFRVTTVNANANEGRSSAAQINLVTKSGSNTWHGSAFEFYRGTLFEANDWFSNQAGVERTPLVRNTFGGSLGGPIVKDKLFFFYSYEGRRDATSTVVTNIVPLKNLGDGTINYSYCLDANCDTTPLASLNLAQNQQAFSDAGINQAVLDAFKTAAAKYPANDTSVGDGLNTSGFRFNSPTPVGLNSHFARFDYVVNHSQNVFVRLNYINDNLTLARYLPDQLAPQLWSHPQGMAAGHTWTISNSLVNNFRYGFTRQAFTTSGDSNGNDVAFRFVFQPNSETHTLKRVTPVHNIADDLSWIHGRHSFQFGVNIRKVNNERVNFGNSYDFLITNPSFYQSAGDSVSGAFQQYLDDNALPGNENVGQSLNSIAEVQNAATAIIGRFSEYTANFTFGKDGGLLNQGAPTVRNFATQAFDEYAQDAWKIRPNLTLTMGLRYSLERPVYETQGFEVLPGLLDSSGGCQASSLTDYFNQRLAAAKQGNNYSAPICTSRSGPANGGKPMYNWDKNNFQPRVSLAWSPNYSGGLLRSIFGGPGKSVIRGGFALTNDYYGQALAVDFDLNNTLGFTSNYTTPANTYDIFAGQLAPEFTDFAQGAHTLPNVVVPTAGVKFPLSQPVDEGERIESSVDSRLQAPAEYVWNLTYERQFKAGTTLSVSYIGRSARHLLARRDVAAFNDVVDPKSGMDWYTAGTLLEKQRQLDTPSSQIASIPFFDNLFPANLVGIMNNDPTVQNDCFSDSVNLCFDPSWTNTQMFYGMQSRGGGGHPGNPFAFFSGNDWTDTQAYIDGALFRNGFPTRFMQTQYGALSAWSTIGNSNYHGMTVTLRQRLKTLTMDFNYTFSHSLDDASGLQTAGAYGSAFIVNPIRQSSWYGNSDFDIRHLINASAVSQLPFGKGRRFGSGAGKGLDAVIGGWQLSTIYRFNTGLPLGQNNPFDDARWATNWNVQANVTPIDPIHTCPDRTGTPKLFGGSACDVKAIYQNFRNAYPGETGPRNVLRYPGAMNADIGLSKAFQLPWSEKQILQFRWEVFNVANYQPFGTIDGSRTGIGVARDPKLRGLNPPSNWSNFTAIQGTPRVMQIGLRFSF